MDKQMEEAFRIPGISGVMCVDKNGLVLGDKGTVPNGSGGALSALTQQASRLRGGKAGNPVICLESEAGSVLIKRTDDLTTAVFKAS